MTKIQDAGRDLINGMDKNIGPMQANRGACEATEARKIAGYNANNNAPVAPVLPPKPPAIPARPVKVMFSDPKIDVKSEEAKPRYCTLGRGLLIAAAIIAALGAALIIGGAITLAVATTAVVASIGCGAIATGAVFVVAAGILGIIGLAERRKEAKCAEEYNAHQVQDNSSRLKTFEYPFE